MVSYSGTLNYTSDISSEAIVVVYQLLFFTIYIFKKYFLAFVRSFSDNLKRKTYGWLPTANIKYCSIDLKNSHPLSLIYRLSWVISQLEYLRFHRLIIHKDFREYLLCYLD